MACVIARLILNGGAEVVDCSIWPSEADAGAAKPERRVYQKSSLREISRRAVTARWARAKPADHP